MKTDTPNAINLSDYKTLDYKITDVYLTFDLDDTKTQVFAKLTVEPQENSSGAPLVLNGEELELKSVKINGEELVKDSFVVSEETLTLNKLPSETFILETHVQVNPEANKALDGLYKSGGIFCTQNEAEGFRRITYFLDRPDNLSKYTTKIIADKKEYPILLSNGNPVEEGDLEGGKHFAIWEDPFFKPCYLYALVAGDLALVQDKYTTCSGREIDLRVYVDKGNEGKCTHSIESLKNSMKWDEERYGLEYDLDIYMIVAVDSFNMGAMENKGLNIFNSAYVLADQASATDGDFYGIESVIGHEYFHNWTGNRVTCRDWFQLTLKEGLTVYRDQEFSSDMNSRVVDRIKSVTSLRSRQFAEDGGPNAHPIKPKSYIEINNFYTSTIYEKGAEVIRMYETLLGRDGFRKGMDKYFELFDGQAVTTEDFAHAMSVANGDYDLSQFLLWYDQAGTPKVKVAFDFNESNKTFSLSFTQSVPDTPGQKNKVPMMMPIKLGLLGRDGKDLALSLEDSSNQPQIKEGIIHLTKESETFVFENISEKPVPSINRNFTAPINLETENSRSDLAFLMAHDSDSFNRYEAGQELATQLILAMVEDKKADKALELDNSFIDAYGKILKDNSIDDMFKAMALSLPGEDTLHQRQDIIDYKTTHEVRDFVLSTLATKFENDFCELYEKLSGEKEFAITPEAMGERALKNKSLSMLMQIGTKEYQDLAYKQFSSATNMTDELAAMTVLVHNDSEYSQKSLSEFFNKWKDQTLVFQKWLSAQASNPSDTVFEKLQELEGNEKYDKTVPNIVRSLIATFGRNFVQFHHESGRGYKLLADKILELDKMNPQIASRFATLFKDYGSLSPELKALCKQELERILAIDGLSKNVFEIISKTAAIK